MYDRHFFSAAKKNKNNNNNKQTALPCRRSDSTVDKNVLVRFENDRVPKIGRKRAKERITCLVVKLHLEIGQKTCPMQMVPLRKCVRFSRPYAGDLVTGRPPVSLVVRGGSFGISANKVPNRVGRGEGER